MRSSYPAEDAELLLKDITGLVEPLPASVREKYIQSGTHYCEMLPLEYTPSPMYMEAYQQALAAYSRATALAVGTLAEKLYLSKGKELVIVSLARAGIPIGILLRRYLLKKYGVSVKHYSISIIRGRGIDRNAIRYILARHSPEAVQFIDGWIGKGAILGQLEAALSDHPQLSALRPGRSDGAVRHSRRYSYPLLLPECDSYGTHQPHIPSQRHHRSGRFPRRCLLRRARRT